MKFAKPHTPKLDDPQADRTRRQHELAITELQKRPGVGMEIVAGVTLADGIATPVAHKLGHVPSFVAPSAPRGPVSAGYIEEVRSSTYDRSKVVLLKATGYGATITVDVMVA